MVVSPNSVLSSTRLFYFVLAQQQGEARGRSSWNDVNGFVLGKNNRIFNINIGYRMLLYDRGHTQSAHFQECTVKLSKK